MTPAAEEKKHRALGHLEAAQRELGYALENLSPVVGLVKEWERVGKLYGTVNALWHRLNGLAGPFRLDSEPRQTQDTEKEGGR
jgi:hypothetical protein